MKYADDIIKFLRRRDYIFVKYLSRGASGMTALLHDDVIDEDFVCKKYHPDNEQYRENLFQNFVREIKLMYQVNHPNISRIFTYFLYPTSNQGFILMEYINGSEIDDYIRLNPERINDVFEQTIEGFRHLESKGILHRDIRNQNLMVDENGTVKIIDLGFGKQVWPEGNFDNSISLNRSCEPPNEYLDRIYDFQTEIYYLGKLFEKLVQDNGISEFKYEETLREMCRSDKESRISSFRYVVQAIESNESSGIDFGPNEIAWYRSFADAVDYHLPKIEVNSKYISDWHRVETALGNLCNLISLEIHVPDASQVINCLLSGGFYIKRKGMDVSVVQDFQTLMKRSSTAKKNVILGNLHTRLDAIPRYGEEDDIPF